MRNKAFNLVLLILVITACNPDKNKKVDQTSISFSTNDATKLFFKNVRQSYYDLEEMEAAKLEIFRIKKRSDSQDRPIIHLAMVNNWRYDEAYLLLEPNEQLNLAGLKLKWSNSESGENGEIAFENGNKETIVRFADQIYEQIQKGSLFTASINGQDVPVIDVSEDREAFRITMVDYYRLVQRL